LIILFLGRNTRYWLIYNRRYSFLSHYFRLVVGLYSRIIYHTIIVLYCALCHLAILATLAIMTIIKIRDVYIVIVSIIVSVIAIALLRLYRFSRFLATITPILLLLNILICNDLLEKIFCWAFLIFLHSIWHFRSEIHSLGCNTFDAIYILDRILGHFVWIWPLHDFFEMIVFIFILIISNWWRSFRFCAHHQSSWGRLA